MDIVRYAQTVLERQATVLPLLPEASKAAQAIRQYRTQVGAPGGCPGCRRRRLLKWLAKEIQASAEKPTIDTVVYGINTPAAAVSITVQPVIDSPVNNK